MVFREHATCLRGRNHGGPESLCKRYKLVTGVSPDDRGADDKHGLDGIVDRVSYRIEIANDFGTLTRHIGVGRYFRPRLLRQQIVRYVEVYGSGSF